MKSSFKKVADATSTPLSSIFGSGFLVIVPILAGAVGEYSVAAMAAVCALAYAVGMVIRFNIRAAEPVLANQPSEPTLSFERSSDLALVLAYVISVCLYLHILSSFVLGGFNADTELNENILTSAVILAIMAIGLTKGLDALGKLEKIGLYVTLLIIVLLLVGFTAYDVAAMGSTGGIQMPAASPHSYVRGQGVKENKIAGVALLLVSATADPSPENHAKRNIAATRGLTPEMIAAAQTLTGELMGAKNLLVPLDQYLKKFESSAKKK